MRLLIIIIALAGCPEVPERRRDQLPAQLDVPETPPEKGQCEEGGVLRKEDGTGAYPGAEGMCVS